MAVIGHGAGRRIVPVHRPGRQDDPLDGRKYEVIGVFEKKESAFGGPYDNMVLIPSRRLYVKSTG